jgi:3-hydroxybutyrate dehydrogenase
MAKVVLVTGASSGLGKALANLLHKKGYTVYGTSRNPKPEQHAFTLLRMDVQDETSVQHAINQIVTQCGRIDILINNAGIQHVAPVESFPVAEWDKVIGINLNAAFHAMRAVIPGMKARGWGRIISTASAHSLTASAFKSAYVAAKHGLTGLSKAVALEVATHGITVNCISPAYVWTPLVEAQIPDTMAARNMTREQVINEVMLERQPTKQFVTPEQVAASAVFLCSDAACQMTGSNLVIDGGWTAQ